ncbi:MAG: methyltransferase domain-containing protein [Candidatus Riflebacteria bacterium]|jgi:S-adenosylmethionine-dependent methyltransferase|nr:methyltransferase domain-containing protein [Candidatus Riflebacteria bacterium]
MDRNFDKLAGRLKKHIYSSGKGAVRLAVLKHDMLAGISEITSHKGLQILDAGGGMGQIARWLAEYGHQVTLCDISAEMLQVAEEENRKAGQQNNIRLIHAPLQEMPGILSGCQYDLILLHGVIEWMQTPSDALSLLSPMLKPGGAISLLFFNRSKLILKWGVNGQLQKAMSGRPLNPRSLTPVNPLIESDLQPIFAECGLQKTSKAGIRIFYGFFTRMVQTQPSCQTTIDLELQYCHSEPFASLGEHTHLILRKSAK